MLNFVQNVGADLEILEMRCNKFIYPKDSPIIIQAEVLTKNSSSRRGQMQMNSCDIERVEECAVESQGISGGLQIEETCIRRIP